MNIKGSRIAVTGASGFIGRYIVDSLVSRGATVVAVVRDTGKVPEFRDMGIEIRKADLADRRALADGFRGADAIVSNAALFRIRNSDWPRHQADNVRGTENVIYAAVDAGVKRVVQVSSVAVYSYQGRKILDEEAPRLTESNLNHWNAYSVSKAVSERRAWEIAAAEGIDLTACRPASVFGAWDPNITRLIRRVLSAWVAPIPCGIRAGLVYAGDVAEGIALALGNDVSVGRAYNLTGPHVSSSEFFKSWKDAGGPWPRVPVPVYVPMKRLWDNTRAETELGWRNRPYAESLRETFARDPQVR